MNNSFHEEYKCYMKNSTLYNKYTCNICGNNYLKKYQLYNDNNNLYINCFESKDYYYLDEIDWNYKECYNSCLTCEINGNETNNNCLKCKDEFIYELTISNGYKNCYLNNLIANDFDIMKNIINDLINDFDINELNNGTDRIKMYRNNAFVLTSTYNQKNNEEINNVTMNLGQCESILKYNYNISQNDSLYIMQIIAEEEGMKIPKLEYEVYYPLNNSNILEKLNLSLCKDTKIEISIKVKINDIIDKYNPSSNYYNDICYKTTSESGTDIPLKTRINEFVDKNMSLCEENCDLIDYNYNKEKAKCSCDIKLNIPENFDIKFDKKDFLKSFTNIKNIMNLEVIKCYKIVYKIKSLIKNYGFYIIGFIIILYFITLFIFVGKSYYLLDKEIYNIFQDKKENEIPSKHKKNKKGVNKIKNKNNNIIKKNKNLKKYNSNFKNKPNKKNFNSLITQNEDNSTQRINQKTYIINNKNIRNINNILDQKDFELNLLCYESALKLDHRTYFEYYISLLKNGHPIIFSFFPFDDYNSKIIKMFLFFFTVSLDFTVNALFFTDDTINKIYQDKGKFNFLYQIPQILYSTLISGFVSVMVKNFALTKENIIELKKEEIKTDIDKKYEQLKKKLKIKFILFFVLAFIILLIIWYYITCFCGIYINTQSHLIKDLLISIVTSLLIPFALCVVPGIFRISALSVDKPSRKYLYKFSLLLESLLV